MTYYSQSSLVGSFQIAEFSCQGQLAGLCINLEGIVISVSITYLVSNGDGALSVCSLEDINIQIVNWETHSHLKSDNIKTSVQQTNNLRNPQLEVVSVWVYLLKYISDMKMYYSKIAWLSGLFLLNIKLYGKFMIQKGFVLLNKKPKPSMLW